MQTRPVVPWLAILSCRAVYANLTCQFVFSFTMTYFMVRPRISNENISAMNFL